MWERNQLDDQEANGQRKAGQEDKEEANIDPTDLKKALATYLEKKKITFNKKDEDKYGK